MPCSRQAPRIVVPAGTVTASPSIVTSTGGGAWTGGGAGGRDARAGGVTRMSARTSGVAVCPEANGSVTGPPYRAAGRPIRWPTTPSGRARRSTRRASPGRSRAGARAPPRAAGHASRPRACASSSSWRTLPTRHGTHWPHDSSRKNWAMRRSVSTRSTVSSKTMITPDPSVAPAARVASNVSGMSSASGPTKTPGGAAEQDRPDGPVARHAAGELDEVAQGRPELDLVGAGARDVAGQAEELRPGRAVGADPGERLAAVEHDARDVGQRLDVVDDRRLAEQPDLDRERRLVARLAALALDRLEERRLLAADVGAGAAPELDVEVEARARRCRRRGGPPTRAASMACATLASASGYSPRM